MHDAWLRDEFEGLPYRVLLPEPYDVSRRYPLVLFLHGSGERGRDNARQLLHGVHHFADARVRAAHRCIVVAPQCPPESTWGGTWFGGPNETQARVVRLVAQLASRRTVDAGRIALLGASMGAIGGWEMLAHHRPLFASAVMLCGEPDVAWAERLEGFPVWSFHGAADELVKPGPTRAMHARLPPPARLTEYPGLGHDIWEAVFAEPGLYDWLLSPPGSTAAP
jgi:predicted peptidase